MHLHSPQSAILSAVIFNALIIVALIPLALRGVQLSRARRRRRAPPQRAHLRHRRTDRAVRRHQGHRPQRSPRCTWSEAYSNHPPNENDLRSASIALFTHRSHRLRLSARRHRSCSHRLFQSVGRLLIHRRRGKSSAPTLLAQKIESPRYFWPRPSAADFATVASGASNQAPTSAALKKADRRARDEIWRSRARRFAHRLRQRPRSALSSPEAALYQAARVAQARHLSTETVKAIIERTH